jgi:hypothetical protein
VVLALSPKQRAVADASAILASFAVPPGARRLPGAPAVSGGVLGHPVQTPGTPDLVDQADWWQVPGSPQQVLGWEAAHVPHRFSLAGSATTDGPPGTAPTWADMFSLPAIPAVLDSRQLVVQVVADGDGTAIRVDAQVTWLPIRPAGEKVPSVARAVTLSQDLGLNAGGKKPPAPVTITDPVRVRRLAALIDGLPLPSPGVLHCPAAFGSNLVLTFRARPGGPALAVATVELSGCGGVDLTIGGRRQPALAATGSTATQILAIAGLHWKLATAT